ncbi:MAG: hypothetical protein K2Z80_19705 [Xanthobacteraceae bacterium]|nr:hypothetical protein [Xanthobacteraceae bacterium]
MVEPSQPNVPQLNEPSPQPATQQQNPSAADWRQRIAGDDRELARQLERYASESDFGKAHVSLRGKLSSGEYRRVPGNDATPEDVAAWRADMGLPASAEDYMKDLALPDGTVLSEADQAIMLKFAGAALDGNIDKAAFGRMAARYYELQDQARSARDENDAAFQDQAEDTLREAWKGQDFKRNKNAIENMLTKWPEGLAENFLAGRMADGSRIGDNPVMAQVLAQIARQIEPGRTLVPDGFTPASQGLAQRIASIEALMGDRHSEYWKGPMANAMQAEYRELIAARDAAKGSQAA